MNSNGNQQITIWQQTADQAWQAQVVGGPRGLTLTAPPQQAVWADDLSDVVIAPVCPVSGTVAALLNGGLRTVAVNGIPVPVGMQLLQHADRLEVSGRTFWISAQASVAQAAYDPALHGDDVFCFLTKARLVPGQQIKICPGLPGRLCQAIYKAEAWDMAMQSDTPMKCPRCGYRAGEAEWHPPQTRPRKSIDGILRLIHK